MPTEDCERDLVVLEDFSEFQREVQKGDSCVENQREDSWKETCLLRF